MPFANKEQEKEYRKQYYLKNKQTALDRAKKHYENNRESILANKDVEKRKEYCKKWRKENKDHVKRYKKSSESEKIGKKTREKRCRLELRDTYVIEKLMAQFGLSRETILKNPQMIENQRIQIKLKREIKSKKYERKNN